MDNFHRSQASLVNEVNLYVSPMSGDSILITLAPKSDITVAAGPANSRNQ